MHAARRELTHTQRHMATMSQSSSWSIRLPPRGQARSISEWKWRTSRASSWSNQCSYPQVSRFSVCQWDSGALAGVGCQKKKVG